VYLNSRTSRAQSRAKFSPQRNRLACREIVPRPFVMPHFARRGRTAYRMQHNLLATVCQVQQSRVISRAIWMHRDAHQRTRSRLFLHHISKFIVDSPAGPGSPSRASRIYKTLVRSKRDAFWNVTLCTRRVNGLKISYLISRMDRIT